MVAFHTLSKDEFNSLADGGGGPETVGRLRASRLSKHTTMLVAVARLAAICGVTPEERQLLEEGIEALAAAPKAEYAALVGHPHTGLWAVRCLARLQRTADHAMPLSVDLGRVAALAAAAAIRAGQSFEMTVPLWRGRVYLPTLGLARIGSEHGAGQAVVRGVRGRVVIIARRTVVALPDDLERDIPTWSPVRRLTAAADGRHIEVELEDLDPGRDGLGKPLATRVPRAEFSQWQSTFEQAWRLLARDHPDRADSLAAGMVAIVPVNPAPGSSGSVTAQHGFGSVAMSLPRNGATMADTLIHEFQHSKLYAVMDLVPLHHKVPDLSYSPWRPDPRPLTGILQGAYAYIGVTDFWDRQRRLLDGSRRMFADFEFARWRVQVARAVRMLLASGRLTEHGVEFVRAMGAHSSRWLESEVPEPVRRLAEIAVLDHQMLWRLENARPDARAVRKLANAWLNDRPCSLDTDSIDVQVRAIAADDTELSVRMDLILREMGRSATDIVAPLGPSSAGPADVALVKGQPHRLVVELYEEQIAAEPARRTHWAGLAVAHQAVADPATCIFRDSPEIVFAVHRAIVQAGGNPPRPSALAEWLGAGGTGQQGAHRVRVGNRRCSGQ
ncbi:HEXXH motif domain-containing protein [Micromonospora andamanensis]|uniref:HEXXH motif domain-containing protein n=1 Tax=Micromonospora andamanensis TaxID=1287068 RepID=UPI00195125E8